ncbi:hypothetical protein D2M30_3855 [Bacillus amyloliquefaciens]|uniref:YwmB family TATA-box binding protein n=1 Tax=Bacillus amyloliquefaciens TaxID=1390 RepID=UPI000F63CC02|nr:YwmB family TATA-box binding protein [Bacillus amyloliquefaciens]QBG58154.1 hypothetical protein D2M30_3855 [Bacillus amyloliquefaciens]
MKKKRAGRIILFFVFLSALIAVFHSIHASELSPLAQIAEGMERQDVTVDEWTLHGKENLNLSLSEFDDKVKELKAQNPQYHWETAEEDKVVKAVGTYSDKKNHTTFKLQLVTTLKNQNPTSYLLYEQMSPEQPENWNDTYEQFERQAHDIFQNKVFIFTCLKGHLNDNMSIVLQKKAEQLMKEFEASPVEHVVEPHFVSVSAFTYKWTDYIMTSKHKMNVQIALRSAGMGEKHTVTVGTPIVTTEY